MCLRVCTSCVHDGQQRVGGKQHATNVLVQIILIRCCGVCFVR